MALVTKPFVRTRLDEERETDKDRVVPVKINQEWDKLLKVCKPILQQPKDSTALKTLAEIGAKVLLEERTRYIIDTVFKNKRNNERTGLKEIE